MPRDFPKTITDFLSLAAGTIGSRLNGADAVSVFAWIQLDTVTANTNLDNRIISEVISGSSTNGLTMAIDGVTTPGSNKLRLGGRSQNSDSFQGVTSTSTMTADGTTWYAVGGVLDFANDQIRVYVQGVETSGAVAFGSSTYVQSNPTGRDTVGWQDTGSVDRAFDGRIAHLAVWKTALDLFEFQILATGTNPNDIAPLELVGYWPLYGLHSPEVDYSQSRIDMTINGTVPAYTTSEPPLNLTFTEEAGFEGFDPITGTTYDNSVTIGAVTLDQLSDGGLDLGAAASIGITTGISTDPGREANVSVTFPTDIEFSLDSRESIYNPTVAIDADVDFSPSGGLDLSETVTIAADVEAAFAEGGGSTYSNFITLDTDVDIAVASTGTIYEAAMTASVDVEMASDPGSSTFNPSIAMNMHPDFVVANDVTGQPVAASGATQTIIRRRR
jgi:hypothetical protein